MIEADADGGRRADCGRRTADDEQKVRTPRKDVGKKIEIPISASQIESGPASLVPS